LPVEAVCGPVEQVFRLNAVAPRIAVEAAAAEDVRRVVVTSSVAALGPAPPRGVADERQVYRGGLGLTYADAKHEGEQEALAAGERHGIEVVVVSPHQSRVRRRTRSDPHARGDPPHAAADHRAHDRHPWATEIVFALFDLLGLRFIPRLRDAGDLLLHRLGAPTGLPVDVVLRSRARPERIREHYDDLLRTAASLKRGWVPASLLITRLKNATPQSPLAAALGEYGRIVRTNFLLVYCADPAERARIAGQLNKGETLHALRRHLVIGSRAQIPADEDDHRRHALCLQILVNAVQVWNARYMTASIDHLHATKPDVVTDETVLARVAPVTHAHVNSLGRYDLSRQPPRAGHLRPLRVVEDDTDRTVLTPPLGVSGDKY